MSFDRIHAALAFCIATAFATPSQAQQAPIPSFEFRAADALRWLPMGDTDEDGIVIPVMVNGQTVNALVDSGSVGGNPITLSKKLETKLRLQPTSSNTASAYGGQIKLEVVNLSSFQLGGLVLTNQSADVAPGAVSSEGDVDIIIGQKFLLAVLMQVDWDKHRARFLLTGDMLGTAGDVPTRIDQRTNFLIVPTKLCGFEHPFVLDTGLEDDVHLNAVDVSFQDCTGLLRSDMSATGLGGRHIKEIVGLGSLQIGSHTYQEIVAGLEDQGAPLVRRGMAGSIGIGILRRSNFVLDAGADRLRFYGSYRYGKRVERPTLGVQFTVSPTMLTITHLMSNSPAARTALEEGDRICAINGKSIAAWNGAFPMRPPAGTPVSLSLCDGRVVQIVSQDFLATAAKPDSPLAVLPEPADIGRATEALALCQGDASQAAIDGCSAVIASPSILAYYKTQASLIRAKLYDRLGRPDEKAQGLGIIKQTKRD